MRVKISKGRVGEFWDEVVGIKLLLGEFRGDRGVRGWFRWVGIRFGVWTFVVWEGGLVG